ncbi:MAG: HAD family hydrolase [Clostridiales bacterium]|nr:HAD family hydrolase [Clostridiales bacterium]
MLNGIDSQYKVIVFDLGGTLMEYVGMPLDWSDFYLQGFRRVVDKFKLNVCDQKISEASDILRSFNPRLTHREVEIMPEVLFSEAVKDWDNKPDISLIIDAFFEGLELKSRIFDHTPKILESCREKGIVTACLTDLPNGMPDRIFKDAVSGLIDQLDLYVSSQICGYRKSNKAGILLIAEEFNVDITDILLVGDEEKDLITAHNVGCDFMYISDLLDQEKSRADS